MNKQRRGGCGGGVFLLLLVMGILLLGVAYFSGAFEQAQDWLGPQVTTTQPPPTLPPVPRPVELARAGSFRHHYRNLTPAQQVAYRDILEQLPYFPESVPVQNLSKDDLRAVFSAITLDQPLLFHMSAANYRVRTVGDTVTAFVPEYRLDREEYLRRIEALAALVETIPLPQEGSDFDVQLALHDFLLRHCEYSDDLEADDGEVGTVYGALIRGSASCMGYSQAMLLLLELNGIDAYIVTGYAENAAFSGKHAWNKVRIDGNWYYLDATWNDPVSENGREIISRAFFNVTAADLAQSHELSGGNVTSTAQNYFRVRGLYFNQLDRNAEARLAQGIVEALDNERGVFEFRMANAQALQQAHDYLFGQQGRIHSILAIADPGGNRLRRDRVYQHVIEQFNVIRIFPVEQEG